MPNISGPTRLRSHTFLTLDALRGIAALSVVIGHSASTLGHPYFAHAYLAVDFFFMLSGFVLSYAYQQRLDDGSLTNFSFMKTRIIRLYPLYIAGTLAGFVYAVVTFLHSGAPGIAEYFFHLLTAIFFIPAPMTAGNPGVQAFPYNVFAWSMFYELLANVLHAILLRRRSTGMILTVAAVAGAGLCYMIYRLDSDIFGLLTHDLPFGLLRVTFSYLVGMLLFRFWSQRDRSLISPFWSALLLLLVVAVPALHHHNGLFDIGVVLLAMPVVLLLGAFSQPSGYVKPIAKLLGLVSYGIYILSMPLMLYTERAWEYVTKRAASDSAPWSGVVVVTTIFLVACAANFLFDIPMRRWLTRVLRTKPPAAPLVISSTQCSP